MIQAFGTVPEGCSLALCFIRKVGRITAPIKDHLFGTLAADTLPAAQLHFYCVHQKKNDRTRHSSNIRRFLLLTTWRKMQQTLLYLKIIFIWNGFQVFSEQTAPSRKHRLVPSNMRGSGWLSVLHKKHIHALHIPAETSLCSESLLNFYATFLGVTERSWTLENANGTLEAHQIRAPSGTMWWYTKYSDLKL